LEIIKEVWEVDLAVAKWAEAQWEAEVAQEVLEVKVSGKKKKSDF